MWKRVMLVTAVVLIAASELGFAAIHIGSPSPGQFFQQNQPVDGAGAATFLYDSVEFQFGTENAAGFFVWEGNGFGTTIDLGAAFGWPGMSIVWAATAVPPGGGWSPNAITWVGPFPMPTPNHYAKVIGTRGAATDSELNGPYWTYVGP